jgi:hypothetical protein
MIPSTMGFLNRMRMKSDWSAKLRPEHKYKYGIALPRHPDHPLGQKNGDPRKVWLYDCGITGLWSVEDLSYPDSGRAYYFENEQDLMVFQLRWQDFTNGDTHE